MAAPFLAGTPLLAAETGARPPAPRAVQHLGMSYAVPSPAAGRSSLPEPEPSFPASGKAHRPKPETGRSTAPSSAQKPEPDYPTAPPPGAGDRKDSWWHWLHWWHWWEPRSGYPADVPAKPKPEPKPEPKPKPTPEPKPEPEPVPEPTQTPTPGRPTPTVSPPPAPEPSPPPELRPIAVAGVVTPTPTPTRSRTPRPRATPSSAHPLLRQRLVLDRYTERRRGTDRKLVLLVMFTGVISVTAVTALNRRARG